VTPTPTASGNSTQNQKNSNSNEIFIIAAIVIIIIAALGVAFVVLRRKKGDESQEPSIMPSPVKAVSERSQKQIFIGYVAEDEKMVEQLAVEIEKVGFKTWYYNRDSIAGSSYMQTDAKAIENSQAVIVVVSPNSIKSAQVTKEVHYAHELGKTFFPILYGITYEDLKEKQKEWRISFGSATSIEIHGHDVTEAIPKLIQGLDNIDNKTT
jgi:excinuclease UvrABC ATPase subunit